MITYDMNGLHFAEMFASLSDLLPGLMPLGDEIGEEWDEDLMVGEFARRV